MTIYDTPADIISKALRGREETAADLAKRSGITKDDLRPLLDNRGFDPDIARRAATALELDPDAMAALATAWEPVTPPDGIRRLEFPFGEDTVNAWRLEKDSAVLVIDAGAAPHDLESALADTADFHLLITHPHHDHLAGIRAVRDRILSLHAPVDHEGAEILRPGGRVKIGPFTIDAHDLGGHHPEALGYEIHGWDRPVLAVGDAVFARSVGGCPNRAAYASARDTIVAMLADKPDDTLLLTGHGAVTTLGVERRQNPFLAAWLGSR